MFWGSSVLLWWNNIIDVIRPIMTWVSKFSLTELHLNILSIWHFCIFRILDWPPQRGFFWMKWNGLKLNEVQGEVCSVPLEAIYCGIEILFPWRQDINCCLADMMTRFWFKVCHTSFLPWIPHCLEIFLLASGLLTS